MNDVFWECDDWVHIMDNPKDGYNKSGALISHYWDNVLLNSIYITSLT